MTRIETTTKMVERVLRDHPETRDSDIALTLKVWDLYYPSRLFDIGGRKAVFLDSLYDLPREDNIKRIRAHFQNTKLQYLPTSLEVALKRGISEDEWRTAMGGRTVSPLDLT